MASISPMSLFSPLKVSATSSSPSLFPLSPKPCKPSKDTKPKRHHVVKVACSGGQNNPTSNPEEGQLSHIVGNRRDVLIGLGGLCGAATLGNNPLATAAPLAPELSTCSAPNLPPGAKPTKCCPPAPTKVIKDFQIPNQPLIRYRQPAQSVNSEYLEKYKEALKRMKALPDSDPCSFTQQAKIHCAYCHDSYHQKGYPDLELQVHFSWIFLPFHRWYLYFYERILGSLINDPTFALPFWNWDTEAGMEIPAIYTDTQSPLYDPLRNANHQPPTLVDLNWNRNIADTSGDVQTNYNIMFRQIVEAKKRLCFFGRELRAGDVASRGGSGSLELVPHNTVHSWTGDRTQPNGEDMGALYAAGRDPVFYSHHANVDRMWNIWKTLDNGTRKDFDDPDWLDSTFLFYDENRDLVRVKIRDCLDSRKIGYDYQQVDLPWLNEKPTPRRNKAQRAAAVKPLTRKTVDLPLTLGTSPVSTVVKRPQKSRSKKEKLDKEEVLVVQIQFDRKEAVKFDVLINEEEDVNLADPRNREFAGSFVNVTHTQTGKNMVTETSLTLGISDLLDDLEADDDDSIVVTLVPQYGNGVIVKAIKIDLDYCT